MKITVKQKMVKVTEYDSIKKEEKTHIEQRPHKIKDMTAFFQKRCGKGVVVIGVEEQSEEIHVYDIPDHVLCEYEQKEGE